MSKLPVPVKFTSETYPWLIGGGVIVGSGVVDGWGVGVAVCVGVELGVGVTVGVGVAAETKPIVMVAIKKMMTTADVNLGFIVMSPLSNQKGNQHAYNYYNEGYYDCDADQVDVVE